MKFFQKWLLLVAVVISVAVAESSVKGGSFCAVVKLDVPRVEALHPSSSPDAAVRN